MLNIQMFGGFSIQYQDKVINDKSKRSKKMWLLLKYLITFRDREISQKEIFELLWPGGQSENPSGALKTQLHRLRAVLDELHMHNNEEIIISRMGSYAFNTGIEYSIDTELFERAFRCSMNQGLSEKEQTMYLLQAYELYKGDFLCKNSTEKWVAPISVYYHSLYIKTVHRLLDIYFNHKRYIELADICRKSLLIAPNEQKIHYMLIKALLALNDKEAAKQHYAYLIDLFYNRQGINLMPEIISLYEELSKADKSFESNIDVVKSQLSETTAEQQAAFFCEYEFFKHVYHLEVRDSKRNTRSIFICLITVLDKSGGMPDSKALTTATRQLKKSISTSLRLSDIFARYSASQFIIMLSGTDSASAEMVMKRIQNRFINDYPDTPVDIKYQVDEAGLQQKLN